MARQTDVAAREAWASQSVWLIAMVYGSEQTERWKQERDRASPSTGHQASVEAGWLTSFYFLVWLVWSVLLFLFVWFVLFIWLNKTNQMNQTDQRLRP